jgi:hypothetical protein
MSNPFASPEFSQPAAAMSGQMRLKRIGVLSVGVFAGAAGALMGLFAGGLVFLVSLAGNAAAIGNQGPAPNLGFGLGGVVFLFFAPVFYGVMGFIGGMLNAVIYNVIAGMTGGIEMQFSKD